jgi:uncharacterized protein YggU (UPF0235/DUF167 family)
MTTRIGIRVRPGASRTAVGGTYGDQPDAPLVVSVAARAVDGAATEAALRALAEALGVRRRDLRLVTGLTSRVKVVEIGVEVADLERILAKLRSG